MEDDLIQDFQNGDDSDEIILGAIADLGALKEEKWDDVDTQLKESTESLKKNIRNTFGYGRKENYNP